MNTTTKPKEEVADTFTPGPWEWNALGGDLMLMTRHQGKLVVLQAARKGMQGACLRTRDSNHCIMEEITPDHPDARLIAAAPTMYDALNHVAEVLEIWECEQGLSSSESALLRKVRETIARADGGTIHA